jgi:hypothetical protein
MKNSEVHDAFWQRQIACTAHLTSTGEKLISYQTCIAQRSENPLTYFINMTYYSNTTSRQQHAVLRKAIAKVGEKNVIELDNIPRDTRDLIYYVNHKYGK